MLVSMNQVLKSAEDRQCCIGAFDTPSLEILMAVLRAAEKRNEPVIVQHAQLHECEIPDVYKRQAQTIFSFLLERFVDAVIPWDTDLPMTQVQDKMVSLISDNYKKIYSICSKDKDEAEKLYLRLLLVTDYICGMTDSYAKDLYQELNGIV